MYILFQFNKVNNSNTYFFIFKTFLMRKSLSAYLSKFVNK